MLYGLRDRRRTLGDAGVSVIGCRDFGRADSQRGGCELGLATAELRRSQHRLPSRERNWPGGRDRWRGDCSGEGHRLTLG